MRRIFSLHMLAYAIASYDPHFISIVCKNMGNLREFLGKWFTSHQRKIACTVTPMLMYGTCNVILGNN